MAGDGGQRTTLPVGVVPAGGRSGGLPGRLVDAGQLEALVAVDERLRCFADAGSRAALLAVTGGWPVLLERAAWLAVVLRSGRDVCGRVEAWASTAEGARALVASTGMLADPGVVAALELLVDYADPVTEDELTYVCSYADPQPSGIVRTLLSSTMLRSGDRDGTWMVEPVLARAWKTLRTGHRRS